MKMHKLEVYVFDFEDYGVDEYISIIEQNRYMHAQIKDHDTVDIGEWDDESELNHPDTPVEKFREYF